MAAFKIYDCLWVPGRITLQSQSPFVQTFRGLLPMENDDREYFALYGGGPQIDYTTVSQSMAQALGTRLINKCDLLVIDREEVWQTAPQSDARDLRTEVWVLRPDSEATTDQEAIDDLNNHIFPTARYVREGGFGGLVGSYGVFPTNAALYSTSKVSIYTVAREPGLASTLVSWRARNDVLLAAGYPNYFNVFCPSIYASYPPGEGWTEDDELRTLKTTMSLFLTECRRLSPTTPVYFYLRPTHGVTPETLYYFSVAWYESLIRHCREIGADGVVCWEGYGTWANFLTLGYSQMLSSLAREFSDNAASRRNKRQRRVARGPLYGL